ncbi:MAG: hypothetical protein DNFNHJIP_00436 [Candidatus Argoarchaeum ethanivorans]|uniref:Uncharacterized protein n=1 Tax=Candidatus Argoarchaeum ethanivorans TaxID=2608793 RepID=A0A812A1Y9_9EURY|nr:MAG: hypothetical protein DNFNHJIP_00436 [Candidatus Argoarchaeum ethanivorans]
MNWLPIKRLIYLIGISISISQGIKSWRVKIGRGDPSTPVEIKTSVTRKGIESGRRSRNLSVASSKTRSKPEGMWTYREGTVGSSLRKGGEDVTYH